MVVGQNNKKIYLSEINEQWLKENICKNKSKVYFFCKRATDIIFGFVGFIIFIILFLPVALLIKIESKGKVIYKQERVGKDRKIFWLYKFRTMYECNDADKKVWREKEKNSITRVGKFLRRTHLDELPQAINILKGDVSFIGPRAEWLKLAEVFEKEIPYYSYRYTVRPGLIGWAQINYPPSKSIKEAEEKFEYDLYYIINRSILLDLEIILKAYKLFAW